MLSQEGIYCLVVLRMLGGWKKIKVGMGRARPPKSIPQELCAFGKAIKETKEGTRVMKGTEKG